MPGSARRCQAIFYTIHERSPYVFKERMNTDPNVHLSVKSDTMHFNRFIESWLSTAEKRAQLMIALRKTTTMTIPAPPV